MADEKYSQAFVREITSKEKARNGKWKTVHKAWKGVLKYSESNSEYVSRPKGGPDTRTANQKRRYIWKQIAKTFPVDTVKTKAEALRALEAWRVEMEGKARPAGFPGADSNVADYLDTFIDNLEASGNVEQRTASGYRTTAKRIREAFPDIAMKDLKPAMIQQWENGLTRSGSSPATVLKYHRLLSEVCKYAIDVRDLDWNPCSPVKTPKQAAHSPNSLTMQGFDRLAATLATLEPSPIVTGAQIAMYTGLRQGEVCGLRWRDYDTEAQTIFVREAIGKAGGSDYSKEPKTKSSIRRLAISPQLAQALQRRREKMETDIRIGGLELSDFEFGSLYIIGYIDGRFYSPTLLSRNWKSFSDSLGLIGTQGDRITFHDLRHSFATRAIARGADVKAVAAYLGHSNAAMTLNVYADADPDSKRRTANLVAEPVTYQAEPYTVNVDSEHEQKLIG